VAQDSLWAAMRNLSAFRENAGFRTWLHRIVRNYCFMELRCKRCRALGRFTVPLEDAPRCQVEMETPESKYLAKECRLAVKRGLAELPPTYAVVLEECAHEGGSAREIGSRLGLSKGAVKSRLHRGRAHLRSALGHHARCNRLTGAATGGESK
jgi:RNA polymerase sigma factor (sigma-70 family)